MKEALNHSVSWSITQIVKQKALVGERESRFLTERRWAGSQRKECVLCGVQEEPVHRDGAIVAFVSVLKGTLSSLVSLRSQMKN